MGLRLHARADVGGNPSHRSIIETIQSIARPRNVNTKIPVITDHCQSGIGLCTNETLEQGPFERGIVDCKFPAIRSELASLISGAGVCGHLHVGRVLRPSRGF